MPGQKSQLLRPTPINAEVRPVSVHGSRGGEAAQEVSLGISGSDLGDSRSGSGGFFPLKDSDAMETC